MWMSHSKKLELVNAHSMSDMTWKAVVIDDRFVGMGIQFRVAVNNADGHSSEPVILIEPLG